jgi:FMN phosphatase YigB (HAD superfamily)
MIIIVVIVTIALVIALVIAYKEYCHIPKSYEYVCVFDLDNTITCGIERAAEAIKFCKDNSFKIAINTARPTKWFDDLKLEKLGLTIEDFKDDFYFGKSFECSFTDQNCFEDSISQTKVDHLHNISKKYNVPPNKIILFDDQYYNIKKAKEHGFSTVYANHQECGLPEHTISILESIVDR